MLSRPHRTINALPTYFSPFKGDARGWGENPPEGPLFSRKNFRPRSYIYPGTGEVVQSRLDAERDFPWSGAEFSHPWPPPGFKTERPGSF